MAIIFSKKKQKIPYFRQKSDFAASFVTEMTISSATP